MFKTDKIYVECDCDSADHVIRFVYDHANEKLNFAPELYMEVQLHQWQNIFKRIVKALEYIFNRESKYGHWDVTLINVKEADKLIELLKKFKEESLAYEESQKTQH